VAAAGVISAGLPLAAAWRHNRHTSLVHALAWATVAWLAWLGTAICGVAPYPALCLTGCAGVAVLGARRPGAAAWHFVVGGLLVVLLRPVWERRSDFQAEGAYVLFLAAVLAVPLLNYLPTRLGPGALMLGCGCALEMVRPEAAVGILLVGLAPWLAWLGVHRRHRSAEFDELWLSYRDRLGYLWASRLREQFNAAAANAGWAARLTWRGLHVEATPAALAALRALLKRFAPDQ
jgi:hypothetical protein